MKQSRLTRHPRRLAAATGILALIGAGATVAPAQVDAATSNGPDMAQHVVLQSGLDNPRQLQRLVSGDFLIAEVGGLAYPVRDGFPVMLMEEAKLPAGVQSLEDLKTQYPKSARARG